MNRPTVSAVRFLVTAYRARPPAGTGPRLHVVLDDGNMEDVFILRAIIDCIDARDTEGERIARLLLQMSKNQRDKIAGRV